MASTPSQRRFERVPTQLPVSVTGQGGVTRDVSAAGVYFEVDAELAEGAEVAFDIAIESALGPAVLKCRGRIVRTERSDGRLGVAVSFSESVLQLA